MEVRVGLHQVGHAVCGKVRVHVIDIDTVPQSVVGKHVASAIVARAALISGQHPSHSDTQRDVNDIIRQAATVGKSRGIAREQPQSTGMSRRRWSNTGIDTQQVRNGSCGRSVRCNRRKILDQRQQVLAWCRRRGQCSWEQRLLERVYNRDKRRIQIEARELRIIHGLVHGSSGPSTRCR